MTPCGICAKNSVVTLLNAGKQPIANRFLRSPGESESTYPIMLGQCETCGTAQLVNPVPAEELLPHFDWITYNEPEGHLDRLSDTLKGLPGLTDDSVIAGVSFKDDTTLARLQKLGFPVAWRIDPATDLCIGEKGAGVETIQNRLNLSAANKICGNHPAADILMVRHILEHAPDPGRFMESLKSLITPDSYIVFEVPDCSRSFANFDYTTLWEEHPVYFTPDSFKQSLIINGFDIIQYECYPYAFENSLVAIVKMSKSKKAAQPPSDAPASLLAYGKAFGPVKDKIKTFFADFLKTRGKIALLGAGHLACMYVGLFEVGDYVEFIADDNPNKQGLFMPGSRLPIYGSQKLLTSGIKLCLLGLNPEIEDKVVAKNRAFTDQGGTFASIFPGSKYSLFNLGMMP